MRLLDKVSLVTGGGSGIGAAIAERFAAEGARVVIADIDHGAAKRTAEAIGGHSTKPITVNCDVTKQEDVERAVDLATREFGHLDVLVNVAGIALRKSIDATTLEEWNRVISVNLTGPFLCTKYAIRPMKLQRSGRIINVSSIAGLRGIGFSAYCASKGGLNALTRELVRELSAYGITVNAIAPGPIDTPRIRPLVHAIRTWRSAMETITPLGRIGKPEDVASAATFLASDDASFVTGHVLVLDGGMTATVYLAGAQGEYLRFAEQGT